MARRLRMEFPGNDNVLLSGLLEIPEGDTIAYVLFAHCFTCGKDVVAASRISRSLVGRGYAVLRFDFTGLGSSDGDFANTNFSSNVQDLIAAANYLRDHYQAPKLLIGHSLGGAAILKAAQYIPESIGLVTIGAPASAEHVAKQFAGDIASIEAKGQVEVNLAGRVFTIKKQFIDDLRQQDSAYISELRKALLIFHSPVDMTVPIGEAEKIYKAAKHPKSFVSLDRADHLLTNKEDSEYVAACIAAWAMRYLSSDELVQKKQSSVPRGYISVGELNHQFTRTVVSDSHNWLADEPVNVGGNNLGPDPYEHLLAALGTCTSMTLRMYANRKKLPLEDIKVELSHSRKHAKDCENCEEQTPQIDLISRTITIKGDLDAEQKKRLIEIADRCPVHRTLENTIVIETKSKD